MLRHLDLAPMTRWLDVSAGGGYLSERAVAEGLPPARFACDGSFPFLRASSGVSPACLARAEDLPLPDRRFDAAACLAALHHCEDPATVFEELLRVTALGGRAAVGDVAPGSPAERLLNGFVDRRTVAPSISQGDSSATRASCRANSARAAASSRGSRSPSVIVRRRRGLLLSAAHARLAARFSAKASLRGAISGGGLVPERAAGAIPAPGLSVEIVGEGGAALPRGQTGEIRIRGPAVFCGYADPAEPSLFDPEGRLRTGDLGLLDAQGELIVRGRKTVSVGSHGRVLCAEELEAAALEQPGVSEAAAVPLGDAFGLLLVAEDSTDEFLQRVRGRLSRRLPAFARPRRVETIPRAASGKVDRRAAARCFDPS